MTKLRALIFDVDGTLAETEKEGHRVAFNQAFAEAGLDWQWSVSFYGKLLTISGGKERIRHYLKEYQPEFTPNQDLDSFIVELHAAKNRHYQKLLQTGAIPLRPGVFRLLQEARQEGIELAIATTSSLTNTQALLEENLPAGGLNWFAVIAAGDIVPGKKPAPDIYHYSLTKLDLKASECLVFEDSRHGLTAAVEAGLKTIVTINDYTKGDDFSEAALVIDSLGEPDSPFTVLQGEAENQNYVNLELLKTLLTYG